MHIGLVISGAGSVFKELTRIFASSCTFSVVTDRPSDITLFCKTKSIPTIQIITPDNDVFSEQAAAFFKEQKCDLVLLFCLRLMTEALYLTIPTVNIHPSLLPAFQGFNPLDKAREKNVRFIGATAHIVDASVDDGPIIAQVITPIKNHDPLSRLHTISFLQKTYAALVTIELFKNHQIDQMTNHIQDTAVPFTVYANPALQDTALISAFHALEDKEHCTITRIASIDHGE